jgi:hypothetical protein
MKHYIFNFSGSGNLSLEKGNCKIHVPCAGQDLISKVDILYIFANFHHENVEFRRKAALGKKIGGSACFVPCEKIGIPLKKKVKIKGYMPVLHTRAFAGASMRCLL